MKDLMNKFPHIIKEIRGFGLMSGFMFNEAFNAKAIADNLFENKLITMPARNNVLRLLPPLIIQDEHIQQASAILEKTFKQMGIE